MVFVLGFTCPFPGAGWWRVYHLAKNFNDNGYQCEVISCSSLFKLETSKISYSGKTKINNLIPSIGLNNPPVFILNSYLSFMVSLPLLLFKKPQFIIISIPPSDVLIPIFLIAKLLKIKIVIDYRDEFEDFYVGTAGRWSFFYRFLKKVYTILYSRALIVTPVTPAVAEKLMQRGLSNIKVVYDGVDTEVFHPFGKNEMRKKFNFSNEEFIICYVGNVYAPYRLDIVIDALKKLNSDPSQKFRLILLGGGDMKRVINYAKKLGLSENVTYFGVINDPSKIAQIISVADCGVIPYDDNPLWQKTFSTKLYEYCAIGLPVIGTVHDYSALAKIVNSNNLGLIAPPVNSDVLASTLKTLCADSTLQNKLHLSTLKFAKKFDKKQIAKDLLSSMELK